jgi:hypothetical protein
VSAGSEGHANNLCSSVEQPGENFGEMPKKDLGCAAIRETASARACPCQVQAWVQAAILPRPCRHSTPSASPFVPYIPVETALKPENQRQVATAGVQASAVCPRSSAVTAAAVAVAVRGADMPSARGFRGLNVLKISLRNYCP